MFKVKNRAFCREISDGWMLKIDLINDVLQHSQCLGRCGGNSCEGQRYLPLSPKCSANFVVELSLPELQGLYLDELVF
jgi:hypothetical protein